MIRSAICLIIALCVVPLAFGETIDANAAGCNGGGGGSCNGPYQLGGGDGGNTILVFDYSIPNSEVKKITAIQDVQTALQVWDYPNGKDTSTKNFSIYLVVGSDSWLLGTSGNVTLAGYKGTNRDNIHETLSGTADLAAFLAALKGTKGKFSVELDANTGTFMAGDRQNDPDTGADVRYAMLDVTEMPEPASLGTAGMGLLGLCWALRKKIRSK